MSWAGNHEATNLILGFCISGSRLWGSFALNPAGLKSGYLGLSYATSDEIIAKGVARLSTFCAVRRHE
jgi:hypothetical protein